MLVVSLFVSIQSELHRDSPFRPTRFVVQVSLAAQVDPQVPFKSSLCRYM